LRALCRLEWVIFPLDAFAEKPLVAPASQGQPPGDKAGPNEEYESRSPPVGSRQTRPRTIPKRAGWIFSFSSSSCLKISFASTHRAQAVDEIATRAGVGRVPQKRPNRLRSAELGATPRRLGLALAESLFLGFRLHDDRGVRAVSRKGPASSLVPPVPWGRETRNCQASPSMRRSASTSGPSAE